MEIGCYTRREHLDSATNDHRCRLCGGMSAWDKRVFGYSRMRVQNGFGDVDFERCYRCDGTGVEPKSFIWDGVWRKPWTWFKHHYDWV